MSFCFSRVPSKLIGAKTYRELAHGAPFSIVFLFILRFSYQLIQLTSSVFITIGNAFPVLSAMLTLNTYCNIKFLIALLITLVHSSSAFTLSMGYVLC
jgi:hypothetical protein